MDDRGTTVRRVVVDAGLSVVTPEGEVDIWSAPTLGKELILAFDEGCSHVIVDLTETAFIDAAGLGTLVAAVKRGGRGSLSVVAPDPATRRILGLVGLDRLFPVYESWSDTPVPPGPGRGAGAASGCGAAGPCARVTPTTEPRRPGPPGGRARAAADGRAGRCGAERPARRRRSGTLSEHWDRRHDSRRG